MKTKQKVNPTKQFPGSVKILNARPYGMSFEDYKIHLKHQNRVIKWYLKPNVATKESFFNNSRQIRERMYRENQVYQIRNANKN